VLYNPTTPGSTTLTPQWHTNTIATVNETVFVLTNAGRLEVRSGTVGGALRWTSNPIKLKLLIPAYFNPATSPNEWTNMTALASQQVDITAIFNPASGPGLTVEANYPPAVATLRAAGGKVLGYSRSCYGRNECPENSTFTRTVNQTVEDALKYHSFYGPIDGVFIDEVSSELADLSYYQAVKEKILAVRPEWKLFGNPGTATAQEYLQVFDVLVTSESNITAPQVNWNQSYPATRQAYMFHSQTLTQLSPLIDLARSRNVGYVYVTDDVLINPYDSLPSYFPSELELL
jgi:hypothetical protein